MDTTSKSAWPCVCVCLCVWCCIGYCWVGERTRDRAFQKSTVRRGRRSSLWIQVRTLLHRENDLYGFYDISALLCTTSCIEQLAIEIVTMTLFYFWSLIYFILCHFFFFFFFFFYFFYVSCANKLVFSAIKGALGLGESKGEKHDNCVLPEMCDCAYFVVSLRDTAAVV